jgi:hypothetical protein
MRAFIFLFCLVNFFSCRNADKFRPQLQSKIDKLTSETELGNNDSTSLAYLKDSCSKEELVKLTNHKKAIIRILSYRALVNRDEKGFFEILENHLSDTAKLTWWYYNDAAGEFTISDLMIRKAERKLTKEQKDTLIDLVLLDHPYLDISNWMIQDIKPNPKYYSIIKSKATRKFDRCGIQMGANFALAKFEKQDDIKILKENFIASEDDCSDWTFKAIETFPDTAFYPLLTSYFENTIRKKKQSDADDLKYFCRAVAQYKNQTSLLILIALTKKETYPDSWYLSYNKEYVFRAIHKYYSPLYQKIYQELKPEMSEYVMYYLDKQDYDDYTTW